jgi:hypothetical protein
MRAQHNGFKRGFALPTVLIASVILLTVLAVAVSATAAVRTTLKNQYYEQLAQTAGEAGVAYAKACLAANENVPQWSDAKPLTPATDCEGNNTLEPAVKALVVAGGGGGGGAGSGGGAGGYIYDEAVPVSVQNYPIVVGAGGAGGIANAAGTQGGNSSFASFTATGGGRGLTHSSVASNNGGSGGGAAILSSGTALAGGVGSQGSDGGAGYVNAGWNGTSGGGGGAGGAGTAGSAVSGGGNGGVGLANTITGASEMYAAGGGSGEINGSFIGTGGSGVGGSGVINTTGTNGAANTGSGGGGGSYNSAYFNGGAGGSGVVIISYLTDGSIDANVTGTVATTTNGLYTVHRFTGNGSFNVTSAGAATCPNDPRCSVTVNDNVRSSFSIGLPTLDADGKAVKIPAGGYTEITRTSTGAVWRTYRQPNVQAAVVPDLCSGATSSTLGWQTAALSSTDLEYAPTDQADVIGISTSTIPFGPSFYRKDFSVTRAATYSVGIQTAGSNVPDDAEIYIDGKFVARSDDQSLGTGTIALTAGCHNVVVRLINSHTVLANSAGRFAASVIQEGASIPTVVSDRTWRATAGDTVNFAHKNFYTGSDTWGVVRDIQTAVSMNSAWTAASGENGARWISTTHSLSGANYPASSYAFFRDSRTITVASPTDVRLTYTCDDACDIYLDGNEVANGLLGNVFSTNVTLSEGTHQLAGVLYNSGLGLSGIAIAAVRISDGAVLTRTDASWLAGMRWQGGDTPMYSYDASFYPVPNTEALGTINALIVGGGGGGASNHGGGGGAGGVRYESGRTLRVGTYSVTVGSGGAGGTAGAAGANGGSSIFDGIISLGGGGGGGRLATNSVSQSLMGGSGGGGAGTIDGATGIAGAGSLGTFGQGNRGGNGSSGATAGNGGGGGGVGVAGGNSSGTAASAGTSGTGGNGVQYSITGSSVYYGGGGSGGRWAAGAVGAAGLGGGGLGGATDGAVGAAGTANTGGGGGGGGGAVANGGAGGSGVVIIAYLTGSMTATGGTITTSGGYTIHRFTSSGTFTVTSIP